MGPSESLSPLASRIDAALTSDLERPWCVHRLYEEVTCAQGLGSRDDVLVLTERAAEEVVAAGRAQREFISATGIGVHCEDSLFWSTEAHRTQLTDFGPEYDSVTVMRRMASHFRCRGL